MDVEHLRNSIKKNLAQMEDAKISKVIIHKYTVLQILMQSHAQAKKLN